MLLLTADSSELTNFINAVKDGITKTHEQGSFELLTPIDFEISVAVTKEGKGGINIAIVGAGGKYEKESITKIKFSMGHPLSLEQLEKMMKVWQIQSKTSNENWDHIFKTIQQSKSG